MYDLIDIDKLNPIHPVIFVVSFIGIIISFMEMIHHKEGWLFIVAPLTYFVNVFLYNLAIFFFPLTYWQSEVWSGSIRLHSLFLFIALIIIRPKKKYIPKNK